MRRMTHIITRTKSEHKKICTHGKHICCIYTAIGTTVRFSNLRRLQNLINTLCQRWVDGQLMNPIKDILFFFFLIWIFILNSACQNHRTEKWNAQLITDHSLFVFFSFYSRLFFLFMFFPPNSQFFPDCGREYNFILILDIGRITITVFTIIIIHFLLYVYHIHLRINANVLNKRKYVLITVYFNWIY